MTSGRRPSSSPAKPRRGRGGPGALIAAAALAVLSSFALGYKLDWSKAASPAPAPAVEAHFPVSALAGGLAMPGSAAAPADAEFSSGLMTPEKWREMTEGLYQMAQRYPAPVAIYLQDLKSGAVWAYHPDETFRAASLIKLPLMVAVFYKIKDGGLSLDQRLVVTRDNRTGGSGTIKWSPDGTSFTVRDLLIHLISESDNTAANMLLNAVGVGYAQQKFREMGLVHTCIHRAGMSLRSGRIADDNYTTAREMNMLLTKIYRGQLVSPEASRMMLDILRYKKDVASRLAKGLPWGWVIAHKTGLERRACHDSAIFFTPYGDYTLTVLTGQNRSYHRAKNFITEMGHLTFAYYGGRLLRWRRDYYARALRRGATARGEVR
ncbi:MAG TPA: serine hydrolase [Elusimicrobiota bacterium]|nr:serine hydrolase [Elusimicrobiota bacterium]